MFFVNNGQGGGGIIATLPTIHAEHLSRLPEEKNFGPPVSRAGAEQAPSSCSYSSRQREVGWDIL